MKSEEFRWSTTFCRFNAKNADKIMFGYSETVTVFYITMVHRAMTENRGPAETETDSFEQFLMRNQHLLDRSLPFKFYTEELFFSERAKVRLFIEQNLEKTEKLRKLRNSSHLGFEFWPENTENI